MTQSIIIIMIATGIFVWSVMAILLVLGGLYLILCMIKIMLGIFERRDNELVK